MTANRFIWLVALLSVYSATLPAQSSDPLAELLSSQQMDLAAEGMAFLVKEAGAASFALIGGLHGDQETPAFVQRLTAAAEPFGYRNVALEMSPWAAARLEASLD